MSMVSPFIKKHHIPQTNVGAMMLTIAKSLDDEQVVAWADTLDWSEPVVSIRRFGDFQGRRGGGYEHVEASSWHLVEILIMTGDDRLVDLLLTKERMPQSFNMNGATLRRNSYMDISAEMSLVNAAIRTGSPKILERALEVGGSEGRLSVNQWFSDGRYSPFVCLADQREMPTETLFALWQVLEKFALASGEQMGKGFGKQVLGSFRNKGLLESCRLGNSRLAEKISFSRRLPISASMWLELLEEGNVAWCTDWLANHSKWPKEVDRKTYGNVGPGRSVEDEPALLLSKAIEQVVETKKTFAKHPNLSSNTRLARSNVRDALRRIISSRGDGSLLDPPDELWAEKIAPMAVGYDPVFAAEELCLMGVPLSMHEALAIAAIDDASIDKVSLMEARIACGLMEAPHALASEKMQDLVVGSQVSLDATLVARALGCWGVVDIDHWDIAGEFSSQIKANMMMQSAPSLFGLPKPARRI